MNPYDSESVAAAIYRALSMPLEERQARQEALFRIVCENDIQNWPDRFLSALTGSGKLDNAATSVPAGRVPFVQTGAAAYPRIPVSQFP